MKDRISYCEGNRFLVYINTFFVNMITDGKTMVGFPDWSRSGRTAVSKHLAILREAGLVLRLFKWKIS